MADHGTEMPDARIRGLYETSAQQLRQRIEQLIVSFAEIEAEADDLRPAHTDDHLRLAQLENRLRYNITALQPLSAQYDEAVAEWDKIDQDYGIMASDTPWTRSMFAFRKKCLTAKSNRPPLPIKIHQLIIAFDGMLNSIAAFRNPGERIASPHSTPNPGYTVETPPTVAGSRASPPGATEPPRRVRIASPAHTAGSTPLARPTPVGLPPLASPDANPRQLAIYNPLRAYEMARRLMPSFGFSSSSPATLTSPSNAADPTPVPTSILRSASRSDPGNPSSVAPPQTTSQPRTTLRRPATKVPIVTQLDFGDDTPVSETNRAHLRDTGTRYHAAYDGDDRWDHDYGYSRGGIMSTADPLDGNIHRTSSMAWDRDYRPRQEDRAPRGSDFYTADTAAPRAAPRSGLPPQSGDVPYGPRPSSGPVPHGPPPPSGEIPPRFGDFDLPPFVPRLPETSDVTRLAADFNSMAAGRGSEASPRITTPLSATDAAFSSAAPSSGPSGSTATVASRLAQTAFYRKSSFVPHAIPDAALPANLVLKVLPLKTFDGDVRSYPEFRDNFIQLIESQAHLSPQQKLQHLVNHLKGTPLQMAEGFGFTDESYIQVIELLEARYGDDIRLQNLLLQDLMSLPAPAPRPADLSNFYRDALQIFNRLKRAGMNMDENIVCSQILLAKLPGPTKMRLMENYPEGRIPASEQLEAIIRHLTILERAESAGLSVAVPPSRGTHANRSRPNSRPGSPGPLPGTNSQSQGYSGPNQRSNYPNGAFVADTEHAHAASHREFRHRCAFCGGSHFSARCHIYATITQRERRV